MFVTHIWGFPISMLVVGGTLYHPPLYFGGWVPGDTWCWRCWEKPATGRGSSLYQLMSTYQHLQNPCTLLRPYPSPLGKRSVILPVKPKNNHILSGYWAVLWKENYVSITVEPWFNAYPWHVWSLINFKWDQSHMFIKKENIK